MDGKPQGASGRGVREGIRGQKEREREEQTWLRENESVKRMKTKWEKKPFARHKKEAVETYRPRNSKSDSDVTRLISHLHHLHQRETHSRTGDHSGQCVNANLSMCCVLYSLPG